MKTHSFLSLLWDSFPFVREYRLKKKLQKKRKSMHRQLQKEKNRLLKRYLNFSQSIRRF